jgi:hypothetical protein
MVKYHWLWIGFLKRQNIWDKTKKLKGSKIWDKTKELKGSKIWDGWSFFLCYPTDFKGMNFGNSVFSRDVSKV